MRAEGDYGPDRRPGWVRFTDDLAVDARRRDFTMNAIYADPHSGAMTDPVAGLADLEARLLRVVGPAEPRLREDPLRMLRAVRLSVSRRLKLEPGTAAAIASAADATRALSVERVFSELGGTFTGPGRGRGLEMMFETGLAAVVLPEVAALGPEQRAATRRVLDAVPEGDPVLAWSAVLGELGSAAEDVLRRLHAPRVLRDSVGEVCRDCERFAETLDLAPEERAHWLRSMRLSAHLAFYRARQIALGGDSAATDEFERAVSELSARSRVHLIDGRDVLSLGVPPGPMVGKILAEAVAELDSARNPTRDVAIEALRRIVSRYVKGAPPPVDRS